MNYDSPKHRPKKSLGQNFLHDQNICRRIVDAIGPDSDDYIIEIGPGQGAITQFIVERTPRRFTVLEMDEELARRLESGYPQVDVIRTDAMKYKWEVLNEEKQCKVVGNLPYNVGSKLIWDVVSRVQTMERAVFMVQHEVAQRLTASPGNKVYGGLTAWVKNFAETTYLFKVPPTVFRPQPKVDSAVIAFTPLPVALKQYWSDEMEQWFEENGVSPKIRPENLTPEQFTHLSLLI